MFTQKTGFLVAAGALLVCAAVQAQDVHPELPIEAKQVTVTRAEPGGFLLVRACESCATVSLQFDASSKAISNGKAVSLSSIPEHAGSAITVIYDPKTKIVKRVFW